MRAIKDNEVKKSTKKLAKIQKELEQWAKRGWMYIDGERDGQSVYKFTEIGKAVASKKLKGLGMVIQ